MISKRCFKKRKRKNMKRKKMEKKMKKKLNVKEFFLIFFVLFVMFFFCWIFKSFFPLCFYRNLLNTFISIYWQRHGKYLICLSKVTFSNFLVINIFKYSALWFKISFSASVWRLVLVIMGWRSLIWITWQDPSWETSVNSFELSKVSSKYSWKYYLIS